MHKAIKALIITVASIVILAVIIIGCLLVSIFADKDKTWMTKFNGPVFFDLKTERTAEKTFGIQYSSEYDIDGEYTIKINFDIAYNEPLNNYVLIHISNDDGMVFEEKLNLLEPAEKKYNSETTAKNITNRRCDGIYGKINLEFDKIYKINVETFFDENLIELKKCELRILKQIL